MIADILAQIDFDLQEAVVSNYQLKDGLYVKIGNDGVEYFIYKLTKNCDDKTMCLKDANGNLRPDMYEWFAVRDYMSNLISMDKPVDPKKKVHSNNYFTFYVKAKEWQKENFKIFENYYQILRDYKKFNSKNEKVLLQPFLGLFQSEERIKDIDEKKKKVLLDLFPKIEKIIVNLNLSKTLKDKFYIKVFFDDSLDNYMRESRIYSRLKIYNKAKYTMNIDGRIYGLSDLNVTVSDNKPFLKHYTRGKSKLSILVNENEIMSHKLFFDYMKTLKLPFEYEPKIDRSGFVVHSFQKDDQAIINDFDIVVQINEYFVVFYFKNHLLYKNKEGQYIQNDEIRSAKKLVSTINKVFFENKIDYYNDPSGLKNELQNIIYLCRDIVKNFERGEERVLLLLVKKYGWQIVRYHLRQDSWFKAAQAANLVLSILEYEGERMDVAKKLDELNERCKAGDLSELASEDFYILSGQIISYLLSKSKKSDKRADMIEPFLRAGRAKKLKMEIETLYFAYKHEIPLNFKKLNNAIALVMAYGKDSERVKDWMDKLFIGLLAENIFFRKDEE